MERIVSRVTWLHRLAGFVGAGILTLVGKTSYVFRVDHPRSIEIRRKKKPAIYAFWHNNQVYLAYDHRQEPVAVMVSQSKDGEYIAQVMRKMGLKAIRGSSTRGGEQAFRQFLNELEQGKQVGITPDGPRGPLNQVQPGVIAAAKTSGCPIIPTAVFPRRKIVFNSWDKFFIPLPFNLISVGHGKPFALASDEGVEKAQEKVKTALDEISARVGETNSELGSFLFYSLGTFLFYLYSVLSVVLAPLLFVFLAAKYGFKRSFQNFSERFSAPLLPGSHKKRIWFHVASVGEWQALKPILSKLETSEETVFIITTSTPEARHIISRDQPKACVRLCPLDIPFIAKRWISQVKPDAFFIVETELWPRLIKISGHSHIPIFIINGRLTAKSEKHWGLFRPLSKSFLSNVNSFFVRTDLDRERFIKIGARASDVYVMGNSKIDNILISGEDSRLEKRKTLLGLVGEIVVVGGSTRQGEEETLLGLFQYCESKPLRLILAPRKIHRSKAIQTFVQSKGKTVELWSEVKKSHKWNSDVMIVDTLGDLNTLYQTADVAFVGGSLVRGGGQNPLEPASVGIPVFFGSSMENFHQEAKDLIESGGAIQKSSGPEILLSIKEVLSDKKRLQKMGELARNAVLSKQGVSERLARQLNELLGL